MKKISRKLLMSILSMAFAVVALGTTTYAWFTMNATATASLQVNVQGGTNGVLLSTDGKSFSSDVKIEYTSADSSKQDISKLQLQPLTYDYSTKPVATTSAFKKLSNAALDAADNATSMYLQFDLYVCTSGASQSVYFSATGNTVESDYKNKSYVLLSDFEYTAPVSGSFVGGTAIKVDSVNALRSIVEVYEGAGDRDTIQKKCKPGSILVEDAVAWGDSSRISNIFGFDNGITNNAGSDSTVDDTAFNFGQTMAKTNAANRYLTTVSQGALDNIDAPTDPTLTTGFGGKTDAIYTAADTANQVKRVRFTFWLEGFDADCFDAIMGQTISINLSFTTERSDSSVTE